MALEFFVLAPLLSGLAASSSPCVLPLYPGFLAYLAGSNAALRRGWIAGLLVLAGVVSFMLALGLLIATLRLPTGLVNQWAVPLSALLIIVLGVFLLFNRSPFATLPSIRAPGVSNPYLNAYVYGLLYGPVSFPCSAAFSISVFALAVTATDFSLSLLAFVMFGLGLGVPLLILAALGQGLQRQITRFFAHHEAILNRVFGVLLVGVGLFILWENGEFLLAAWGLA